MKAFFITLGIWCNSSIGVSKALGVGAILLSPLVSDRLMVGL